MSKQRCVLHCRVRLSVHVPLVIRVSPSRVVVPFVQPNQNKLFQSFPVGSRFDSYELMSSTCVICLNSPFVFFGKRNLLEKN